MRYSPLHIAGIFFLTLSILYLNSCTKEEPIKIGFIGGLSGRVADLGISGRNGATLAVEQRNNSGGVNGKQIQLVIADDKQDRQVALKEFAALISQGVEAIIGHMTSSMSITTVPVANKNQIVLMSPTSTTTDLSDRDDYFFRVCETTDIYGTQMARYLRNKVQLNKATVIYDLGNKSYTESWISHFIKEFTRLGGEIVQKVTYISGQDIHFADVALKALQIETDGIIISSSAVDAAMICQQIRKVDDAILIGTSEWAATEGLVKLGGIAVEGIFVSQFFDRYSKHPKFSQFKKEFKKRFGMDPGFPAVGAYDATNVILDTLTRQESKKDLKEQVLEIGIFEGIQGAITFNEFGDSDRKTFISTIRNGKFVSPGN